MYNVLLQDNYVILRKSGWQCYVKMTTLQLQLPENVTLGEGIDGKFNARLQFAFSDGYFQFTGYYILLRVAISKT